MECSLDGDLGQVGNVAFRESAHEHVRGCHLHQVAQSLSYEVDDGAVGEEVLAQWSCKTDSSVLEVSNTSYPRQEEIELTIRHYAIVNIKKVTRCLVSTYIRRA